MTLDDLKTDIKWEGKIKGDIEAEARLDNLILDAAWFIAQSHPELQVTKSTTFTTVQSPSPYFPTLGILRVELNYDDGDGNTDSFIIPEEGNIVGMAPFPTWPKCYHIEGNADLPAANPKGLRIILIPSGTADETFINYTVWFKSIPSFTTGTDTVPPQWVNYLKKEVLARLSTRRARDEDGAAKQYVVGSQAAIQVEIGSDKRSIDQSN